MSLAYAQEQRRKKEEEEKKQTPKVEGRQQKTQSNANKPVGTTSIPKDNSRAQKSAASSLRPKNIDTSGRVGSSTPAKEQARRDRAKGYVEKDPTARNYYNDTRTRRTEFRNTKQVNEDERKEKRVGVKGYSDSFYNRNSNYTPTRKKLEQEQTQTSRRNGSTNYGGNGQTIGGGTISRIPSADDLPSMGVNQMENINDYIRSTPDDYNNVEIDSRKQAEEELENILHGNRKQLREDAANDSNTLKSAFYGAGAGALGTLGDLAGLSNRMKGKGQSTEGMSPDDIYNRAMATGRDTNILNYNNANLGNDYDAYKDYVVSQIESGAVTPDEIQKMRDLEDLYTQKIPAKRLEEIGKDARAINEGYASQNPIANMAGNLIPMILGNAAIGATGVLNGAQSAANAINNPVLRTAAQQGVNLIPDLLVDTLPEVARNINEDKSTDEIAKAAALNVGLNAGANALFDYAPKAVRGIADRLNASNIAKQATEEAPEVTNQVLKNIVENDPVPEIEQIAKQAEDARQAVSDLTENLPIANEPAQSVINSTVNNDLGRLRDIEIDKLAEAGNNPLLSDAYENLVRNSTDSTENFNAALKNFQDIANANGITNVDNSINRLSHYVNGQIPDVDTDVLGSITNNIDMIDNELAKLDAIGVPPTKNGTDWLSEAHTVLRNYEDAVFNGEDINSAQKALNRALGNLDTQAKKLEGYDGAFSQWKGGGTLRGDLYSNTNQIPGAAELSSEKSAIVDDWLANEDQAKRFAQPANGMPNANNSNDIISSADDLSQNTDNISETDRLWNILSGESPIDDATTKVDNAIPEVDNTIKAPDEKIRQGRTNVFERSGITEDESQNIFKAEDYSYVPDTNPAQLERGAQIANRPDFEQNYLDGFDPEKRYSVDEIDAMMMKSKKYRDMARNSSDAAEKERLYAMSKRLSMNSVKAVGDNAASMQGWQKWVDTPEHVVDKSYGVMKDITDNYLGKNKNAERGIRDVAQKIQKVMEDKGYKAIIDSGDMTKIAKLKSDLSNAIDEILSKADKTTRNALEGLTESEINDLIYNRSVSEINRALDFHAATGSMGIKDSTLDTIWEIMAKNENLDPNSKEFVQNEQQIYSLIANDITHGRSFGDKLDAWRYMSMLSSPATHLRNITGNLSMRGVAGAKNNLAAVLESAADRISKNGIDRTKSVLGYGDRGLVEAARKDATEHSYRALSGNMYTGMKSGISDNIKPFDDRKAIGRGLNKANSFISDTLSFEDELTKIDTYSTALAGYLKANGFDESILSPDAALSAENVRKLEKVFGKGNRARDFLIDTPEKMWTSFIEDARQYAINQAKIQTFNNTNEFAGALSQFTKKLGESQHGGVRAVGKAIDVTIPFKNVPSNVLETALAYSPAEMVKVMSDIPKLRRGEIGAAEFIDHIAKTATGTAGVAIGAMLAHEGLLNVTGGKGTKEKNFDKATDKMNDSINIGGHSLKLTQLSPSASPLLYGATAYATIANKDNGEAALDTIINGLGAIADGVVDMTMLQGISNILDTVKYSEDEASKVAGIATQIGTNFAGQFVPTIGGLVEKGLDPTARETYYTENSGIAQKATQALKYDLTKLPGSQFLGEQLEKSDNQSLKKFGDVLSLEPRIDSKGNEVKQKGGNAAGRLLRGTLPLEMGNDRSTATDNKLRELAYQFPAGDDRDNVFPYIATSESKFKNSNDENVVLSEKQWTEYKKAKGQMTDEMIDTFINSPEYESLDNVSRADVLSDLYKFAKKYNQNKIADGKMDGTTAKMAELYEEAGMSALVRNYALDYMSEDAQKDLIDSLPDDDKAEAMRTLYGTTKTATERYDRVVDILGSDALPQAYEYYSEADYDGNGKVKQSEMEQLLNSKPDLSNWEKANYWQALTGGKKNPFGSVEELPDATSDNSANTYNASTDNTSAKTDRPTYSNNTQSKTTGLKKKQLIDAQKRQSNVVGSELDSLPDAEPVEEEITNNSSDGLNWNLSNGYNLKNTKTYQRAVSAGVSDADFNRAWFAADADGNGYMKKAEAQAYVNTLPDDVRNMWFNILYKGR